MSHFKHGKRIVSAILALAVLPISLVGCGGSIPAEMEPAKDSQIVEEVTEEPAKEAGEAVKEEEAEEEMLSSLAFSGRPSLLGSFGELYEEEITPALEPYSVNEDLSNIINADQYEWYMEDPDFKEKLVKNKFVVMPYGGDEFFDVYEPNRYDYIPNFITVDSMLHTYHLYFGYLLKRIEKEKLSGLIGELSNEMLEGSIKQYEMLKGTEWEEAVLNNMAFFAVGLGLMDENAELPQEVAEKVADEISFIEAADGISESPIFDSEEDYSQYKPRGYYDTDEALKKYFKTMMWYGRINFAQSNELMDRSALLITLLLNGERLEKWEEIYQITSFFAGTSDDNGYYEYYPIVSQVYGEESLLDNPEGFETYHRLTGMLPAPRINSVPVYMADSDETVEEKNTGFRFMGQRFTIDASIFAKLVYRAVEENSMGELRMLPDALDVPAALGSDLAMDILREDGNMDYENYEDNLNTLREEIEASPEESWNVSLYSGWLRTLDPLLEEKREGYPSFMQSEAWDKKKLTTFLGSYTELKHDTILYAKQIMAEMGDGGEEPEVRDDRGYVEPEPVIFASLASLISATREGLASYELLDDETVSDLDILEELCIKLKTMSEKELKGELLSDEEYELIRDFGGQIEHFWQVAKRDEAQSDYFYSVEYPAALVADIATDPNGSVLEVGTGNPVEILVVIEVDGKLKIAEGAVFSFYQFPWPMDDRLTDGNWRKIIGAEWDESGEYYKYNEEIKQPAWSEEYRYEYK